MTSYYELPAQWDLTAEIAEPSQSTPRTLVVQAGTALGHQWADEWRLLVLGHRADQFYKPRHDPKDQACNVEPGGVQPAVETHSEQPAGDGCGREDESQFRVTGRLRPCALFVFATGRVFRTALGVAIGFVWGHGCRPAESRRAWNISISSRMRTASFLRWPWLVIGSAPPVESMRMSDQSTPVVICTDATCEIAILSSVLLNRCGFTRLTCSGVTTMRVGKM